jgi:3-oxoacyl-[acyl-carrier protein] reductase
MDLTGKTAIVTGGGRDIGLACVMRLAEAGANVVLNYHKSSSGAESAAAEIAAKGGRAVAVQGDLTQDGDAQLLAKTALDQFGSIDILIHNTGGLLKRQTMAEMSLDHWNAVMDVNVMTFWHTLKAVLPHMSDGGAITVMASQAGRDGGGAGAVAYAAAKGAIMTMTRGLAKELGPRIRVNSLCPGMIDTDFHNIFTKPEVRTHVANVTPLKREGKPEDVANLAVFLSSDDAAFITGANVDINGGMLFS